MQHLLLLVLQVLLATDYQAFMMAHYTTSATVGATTDAGLLSTGKASLYYRGGKSCC